MEEKESKNFLSSCNDLSNSWWGRGREEMRWRVNGDGVCMCVRFWGGGTERRRESVCLDQLHSKSVYSAQFGIKHNRLLSACCCVWRPIKMEFIAALRANPNYTFFSPQHSVFLHHASLFCASSSPRGDGWMLLAAAVWWEVLTVHYGPVRGHMLDMPAYLSSLTWVKRMLHIALEECCTISDGGGILCISPQMLHML